MNRVTGSEGGRSTSGYGELGAQNQWLGNRGVGLSGLGWGRVRDLG